MENLELLKQIGLDEKESLVYLALLELGDASVHSIASKAGLKRPTTYLVLDSLLERGLVSQIPRKRKAIYVAESPEKLLSDLRKKESLMQARMPALLAMHNVRKDKPQVKFYQGKNAVEEVYHKILKAKEVRFFATIRDIIEIYPQFPKDLVQKAKRGEIRVQEILTRNPKDLIYIKSIEQAVNYEQRLAPEGTEFLTDNALFDGTVVFFSYSPFIFAVEISSKDIHESLSTLFNMAWDKAERIGIAN